MLSYIESTKWKIPSFAPAIYSWKVKYWYCTRKQYYTVTCITCLVLLKDKNVSYISSICVLCCITILPPLLRIPTITSFQASRFLTDPISSSGIPVSRETSSWYVNFARWPLPQHDNSVLQTKDVCGIVTLRWLSICHVFSTALHAHSILTLL